jgi:hypothetical protein
LIHQVVRLVLTIDPPAQTFPGFFFRTEYESILAAFLLAARIVDHPGITPESDAHFASEKEKGARFII